MSTYAGLRTEIPEGMEPTAQAIAVILAVDQKGAAKFVGNDAEGDDVLTSMTIRDLKKIADAAGYDFLREGEHVCFVIDDRVSTILV